MKLLVLIGLLGIASPAFASAQPPSSGSGSSGSASAAAVSPNQAQNHQNATGVINQTTGGGFNQNTQYNNSTDNDYGFGGGVVCRGSHLSVGGFANGAQAHGQNANGFGGLVAINIPLGGQIGRDCGRLAAEVLLQRQLDTCLTLLKAGVSIDIKIYPELARCHGLRSIEFIAPVPAPAPVQAPTTTPTKPIRGLG